MLLDIWMPDMDGITLLREWSEKQSLRCPVVMLSGHGTVETAVEATRLGAFDFVEKPLSIAKLLRTAERALEAGKRRRQAQRTLIPPLVAPVGKSRLMQKLREQVQQVAGHDAPVLLVGEPGTGREAFARYMHSLGPRAAGPFVAVTCASLDDATAAAKLRGVRAPAARPSPGYYEQARGGTLFLGGIEDLSAAAQRLLLADLEQRGWQREGRPRVAAIRGALRARGAAPGHDGPAAACAATCSRTSRSSRSASRRCGSTPRTCRTCCVTTWTGSWTRRACRSGASRSPRRTGSATTPGRATCGSCGTSCSAC